MTRRLLMRRRLMRRRLTGHRVAPNGNGPGFTSEDLARTLDRLDDAHNYADWVAALITPHLSGRVLEIGAGIGSMSARIRPHADTLVIGEPHHESYLALTRRFDGDHSVTVTADELSSIAVNEDAERFDAVVMVNVLEHIADDLAAATHLHHLLHPGGRLIIFVPAFEALMSNFDRRIGHHRRYRRSSLERALPHTHWQIDTMHYVNAPGFVLWWLGMRILRLNPATSPATRLFDRYVVPRLRTIETWRTPPCGQSLFVVAHKR